MSLLRVNVYIWWTTIRGHMHLSMHQATTYINTNISPMTICKWLEEVSFFWLLRLTPNKYNPKFIHFSDLKKKQKALNSWAESKMTGAFHFGNKRNWERSFQGKISLAIYFWENVEIILLRKSNTKNEKFLENALDTFMCTQRVSPFFSQTFGKSNFKKRSIHYLEFLDY